MQVDICQLFIAEISRHAQVMKDLVSIAAKVKHVLYQTQMTTPVPGTEISEAAGMSLATTPLAAAGTSTGSSYTGVRYCQHDNTHQSDLKTCSGPERRFCKSDAEQPSSNAERQCLLTCRSRSSTACFLVARSPAIFCLEAPLAAASSCSCLCGRRSILVGGDR